MLVGTDDCDLHHMLAGVLLHGGKRNGIIDHDRVKVYLEVE